jgi:hypothetical protein
MLYSVRGVSAFNLSFEINHQPDVSTRGTRERLNETLFVIIAKEN